MVPATASPRSPWAERSFQSFRQQMSASREQLQEMLAYCLAFARTMLESSAELHSFGAVLDANGKVAVVCDWDDAEHLDARDIYRLLAEKFQSQAASGQIVGTALASNLDMPTQYDSPA